MLLQAPSEAIVGMRNGYAILVGMSLPLVICLLRRILFVSLKYVNAIITQ